MQQVSNYSMWLGIASNVYRYRTFLCRFKYYIAQEFNCLFSILIIMSFKSLIIPTLNLPPKRVLLENFVQGAVIPRIIHQTFYNRNLPTEIQANVDKLRRLNPNWEYRFYDDDDIANFIQSNYPPIVWSYFRRIDPLYGAARADLFRYLLIYKVGGIYFDIKSSVTRPIEEVLQKDDTFLLSNWGGMINRSNWGNHYELRNIDGGEYQQWFIATVSGHPYLKEVLETVLSNIDFYYPSLHGVGKKGVLRVTGPIAYTLAIHRVLTQYPHRVVDSLRDLGFEYNIYGDQSHEVKFKSHYSRQTMPVIQMGLMKKQLTYFYGLLQATHDLLQRRLNKKTPA